MPDRIDRSRLDAAGPVPRRVAALLVPAPRTSALALAVALGLIALAGFCALEAADDLRDLIELAHMSATGEPCGTKSASALRRAGPVAKP